MKLISAMPHAILDYGLGLFLLASPWLFGFDASISATGVMVSIGAIILFLSLLTNYPLGVIKVIPFPLHGTLETVGTVGLLSSPWLFHFANVETPRTLAIVVSIAYFGVISLTNYTSYQENRLTH
jgi:SPW repeat